VQLVCGFLGCDVRPFNPLLANLPRLLRASDRGDGPGGTLRTFMEAALDEATRHRPGAESVLARLSELMFVEVVRRHLEALPRGGTGWLAGLRDEHVGRALALLHASPGRSWSLPALAREVGVSRSVLADRFAQLVGEPPMQYLARWRMQVASGRLTATTDGLAAIAGDVGYGSEAAFNRAFKKAVGVPPATWRRRARAAPPAARPGAAP
jgi:transcriptional regulator GlxA family with amidase domain